MAGLDLRNTFRTIALAARLRDQRGQGLVEYALIIALVSVILVSGLLALSGELGVVFGGVVTTIDGLIP
jgi:Flp pilus assembly pilin Flp